MDGVVTIVMLEDNLKLFRSEESKINTEMQLFCRTCDDPVAQDIHHRLEVIEEADKIETDVKSFCSSCDDPVTQDIAARLGVLEVAWDTFRGERDKYELMYDQSKRVASPIHVLSFFIE